jgi:hypothetical protein
MSFNRNCVLALFAALLLSTFCSAQAAPARPFHDGPVWDITFVKVKAGFDLKYTSFIANEWKKEQEALKKANLILDYKVIATEAHSLADWDMMLMVEYKDLATMEANGDKMEAVAMQALSTDETKTLEGYKTREEWREIVGTRLAREIILEPKR